MSKPFSPHILTAQNYWRAHLRPSDTVIDMTCGNGHDTFFLSKLVFAGMVYGFDIQKEAIDKTRALVGENPRIQLIHDSHEKIASLSLAAKPRLIVYNLGYLPGGDKSVVTTVESTLKSLKQAMELLAPDGAISITCYPGHEEGGREEEAIGKFLEQLPSHKWRICHHRWVNRPKSPTLFWMQAC